MTRTRKPAGPPPPHLRPDHDRMAAPVRALAAGGMRPRKIAKTLEITLPRVNAILATSDQAAA